MLFCWTDLGSQRIIRNTKERIRYALDCRISSHLISSPYFVSPKRPVVGAGVLFYDPCGQDHSRYRALDDQLDRLRVVRGTY